MTDGWDEKMFEKSDWAEELLAKTLRDLEKETKVYDQVSFLEECVDAVEDNDTYTCKELLTQAVDKLAQTWGLEIPEPLRQWAVTASAVMKVTTELTVEARGKEEAEKLFGEAPTDEFEWEPEGDPDNVEIVSVEED